MGRFTQLFAPFDPWGGLKEVKYSIIMKIHRNIIFIMLNIISNQIFRFV